MLLLSKLTVAGSNPLKFIPVGCVSEGAVFVVPEVPHSGRLGPHALDFLEAAVARRNGVSAGEGESVLRRFFLVGCNNLHVFFQRVLCVLVGTARVGVNVSFFLSFLKGCMRKCASIQRRADRESMKRVRFDKGF